MEKKIILRFVIVIIVIAVLLFLFFKLWLIVMPFLVAYIFHFALKPLVYILEQRGVKHRTSVALIFIAFLGILVLFLQLFIPAVISELLGIQDNFPEYSKALSVRITWFETSFLGKFSGMYSLFNTDGQDLKGMITSYISSSLPVLLKRIPGFILNLLPLVLYILVIPFATFFFLLDEYRIKKMLISLVPNRYFEITLNLFHSINRQFGWLLRGMMISAAIISTLVSTGLWIIGLEYPILVGIFSGLANLIPYAGPIVGTVAAFLVAMMTGADPVFFLYIMLVFLTVNLIDNILVQPMVLARAANLHPLFVIFLVLLGSKVGGILGMLIAVPLASLIRVVIKILFKELKRPLRPDFSRYRDIEPSGSTVAAAENII